MIRSLCVALLVLLPFGQAEAHRSSDAFVTLLANGGQIEGQWEIAVRDLEATIGIDADGDRSITWGELRASRERVATLLRYLTLSVESGDCTLELLDLRVNERNDGPYAWLDLGGSCPVDRGDLSLDYDFMFGIDPTHRAIVALGVGSEPSTTAVLSPENRQLVMQGEGEDSQASFTSYLREGVIHIWIGYDHILFLLALLLPCVLRRRSGAWQAAESFGEVLREVFIVVTAFTLAHSVTLGLAVFEVITLPSRLVEAVIALTVVLAALNNLYPVVTSRRYAVALVLGLIHGFGFASVLGEVGLPTSLRLLGLGGFNLGVEIGQLAIVAVAVPLLYALRRTTAYRPLILHGGSIAVAAMAAFWLAERTLLGE